MPNIYPTQDQSSSNSALGTQRSGSQESHSSCQEDWRIYQNDRRATPTAISQPPTTTQHSTTSESLDTEGTSNANKEKTRPETWKKVKTDLYDAYTEDMDAGRIRLETIARAKRLRQILPSHKSLCDAAINTAETAKTTADHNFIAKKTFAERTFEGKKFSIRRGIWRGTRHGMSREQKEEKANFT